MAEQTFQRGVAAQFPLSLVSAADPQSFQANPTLAAGDVKVSKDGGARTNIATLPSVLPAGSTDVVVVLSATEMDCDALVIEFIDAAGAEWLPAKVTILPASASLADVTALLGSGQITTISPISVGGTVTLRPGDDYYNADGRAISWTDVAAAWPDLTGASIALHYRNLTTGATGSFAGSVVSENVARLELSSAQTTALGEGSFTYALVATLASPGHVVTLARGNLYSRSTG